jgi:hypothetical protein
VPMTEREKILGRLTAHASGAPIVQRRLNTRRFHERLGLTGFPG